MHQQNPFQSGFARPIGATQVEEENKRFMWRVYRWMTVGLAVTGLTALFVAMSPTLMEIFADRTVHLILFFGLIGLSFAFGSIAQKSTAAVAMGMFLLYAFVMGLFLSVIFMIYTAQSIGQVFFISSGMFGGLSAYGYLTKRDLTSVGSFCMMGLWGLLLAIVVNIFVGSNALGFIISCAGVLIFVGLTAYDTQKIKEMNVIGNEGTDDDSKEAINGALILYLDFINLFLYLLRLLGRRR